MLSVFLFVLSVFAVFASDASAASSCVCNGFYGIYAGNNDRCYYGSTCGSSASPMCSSYQKRCTASGCGSKVYSGGYYYVKNQVSTSGQCSNSNASCNLTLNGTDYCYYECRCSVEADADSICPGCNPEGPPIPPPQDTSYVCQNSGGPVEGGFGGPYVAKLFACVQSNCLNTRDLAGTCQDWGFCEDGEDNCTIPKSKGSPPCGRSGPTFTTSSRCYYACADGKDLSCKPVSTGYVAGNVYAGECPSDPPDGCRPSSSSSGSSGSSSSDSGLSSESSVPPPSDTISFPNDGSEDYEIDYTAILQAIHDTLHRANVQRDFLVDLQNAAKLDLDNISSYNEYIYNSVDGVEGALSTGNSLLSTTAAATTDINNRLSTLQENGFSLVSETAEDLSNSRELLDEINRYLRGDSLLVNINPPLDTTYNPLLRGIKDAIEEGNAHDSTVAERIEAKIKDTSFVTSGGPFSKLLDFFNGPTGSDSSYCDGFNSCTASGAKDCFTRYPEWSDRCLNGGSPFDTEINIVGSILDKLLEVFWGEDSTEVSVTDTADTNFAPSPLQSSASALADSANRSIDLSKLSNMVDSVRALVDSAKKSVRDTVKIQPDSLWLDSSGAAQYVQNMLLPAGTVQECFVCRADLGNFGGLSDTTLKIYIDFANFGGFNWCEIIRVVVKIIATVVCVSLTLGSWAAAFGYNPKNDA